MITVQFQNVGRNKLSWAVTIPELSSDALVEAVRHNGALRSEGIDCDLETKTVYAGFRPVGTFTVHDGNEAVVQ